MDINAGIDEALAEIAAELPGLTVDEAIVCLSTDGGFTEDEIREAFARM
jgi:hypothetical protein